MTNLSAHDVFWLARYAHNTLDPLIKAAQQYEPTIHWQVVVHFADKHPVYQNNFVDVMAHWDRDGMFIYSPSRHSKTEIDAVAAKVQAFIDTEQAALEAEHDAEALYATKLERMHAEDIAADAAADADFEFQIELARERADIEHDEDAHDIYLQNEYAGN